MFLFFFLQHTYDQEHKKENVSYDHILVKGRTKETNYGKEEPSIMPLKRTGFVQESMIYERKPKCRNSSIKVKPKIV